MEGVKSVVETEELHEEDVWAVVNPREGSESRSKGAWRANSRPTSDGGRQVPSPSPPKKASSAPVNIPDWSKILKKKKMKIWDDDDGSVDEVEMVPPHEYLARRLARTQIGSHSMCEGVGRTLKGRDLRKTRDAILTKTGFIE